MTKIFDGKTTMGWNLDPKIWTVDAANMALHAVATNGGQVGKTIATYDTFRLVLTERLVASANHMGVCIWGAPSGAGNYGYAGCLDFIAPHGSIWEYGSPGKNITCMGTADPMQWHQIEILVDAAAGTILGAVNGVQTTYYKRGGPGQKGPIGLQYHAGASNEEYKDIWVEPNPAVMMLVTVKNPGPPPKCVLQGTMTPYVP
jgi:hypothetical protein